MADHKREQILDAIVTLLGALAPATVDKVVRGRDAPFAVNIDKGITIYQGSDIPEDDESWHVIHSVLTINIDIHVKENIIQINDVINSIRKAISIALWADYTLGLIFVSDMNEGESLPPEIDGAGEQVTSVARSTYIFKYARNRADPSL